MDMESVMATETQSPAPPTTQSKKTWVEPEITVHQELKEITLAIQCQHHFPECISVSTPPV
jgi:hypothetical protein